MVKKLQKKQYELYCIVLVNPYSAYLIIDDCKVAKQFVKTNYR
jgi:hypothetical protein